jgi:hypothetical protein
MGADRVLGQASENYAVNAGPDQNVGRENPADPAPAMPTSRMTGAPRSRHGDRYQPPAPRPPWPDHEPGWAAR